MIDFKYYICTYFIPVIIFFSLMITVTYVFFKNKIIKSLLIFIELIFFVIYCALNFYLKDIPVFKPGDCFIIKNKIISETPIEKWHKPFESRDVEAVVLKTGNKNYYIHTNIPSLEDFAISMDLTVKKSDCSLVFARK